MTIYRQLTDGMGSPELAINENFLIDQIMAAGVIAMDVTTPPGSPANGDAYIVANDSTGAWADRDDQIAYWFDEIGVWKFIVPLPGLRIWVDGEGADFRYLGGSSSWDIVAGAGTVTEVNGTGTVAGLTLTGTVTGSGDLTLGGTLTVNLTSMVTGTLPVANGGTGITSFATGIATFLGTSSSANLRAALTDETGTGVAVFNDTPTLIAPLLGTPTSGTLTNCTGYVTTTEVIAGYIATVADKTYKLVVKIPHGATITEATTISESGTCTATFKINTTALGGTANSVSSSETSQSHSSSNVASAGDDIQLTVSSNSSCLGLSFSLKYTRTLS